MTANHSHAPEPRGSVLDLIGKTPMVEVRNFDTGPCRLFVKLESANPGGSIKDRIARLDDRGGGGRWSAASAGGTLVEATAGNTGLGLAQVGAAEGLQAAAGGAGQDGAREDPAPARHGRRRAHHPLRRRQGPSGVLPGSGRARWRPAIPARLLHQPVREPGQSAGARDHHRPRGLRADGRRRRRGGGRRRLRRHADRAWAASSPGSRRRPSMVLADPVGSILAPLVETRRAHQAGSWVVEGIGEDFVPDQLRPLAGEARPTKSPTPRASTRRAQLLRRTASSAARRRAPCWPGAALLPRADRARSGCVSFVCDTGSRYLSKVYNDSWVIEQGLTDRDAARRPA